MKSNSNSNSDSNFWGDYGEGEDDDDGVEHEQDRRGAPDVPRGPLRRGVRVLHGGHRHG